MRLCICSIALGLLCSAAVGASERTLELGGLRATVWEPESAPPGRLPVLIFSHGFHGCATQSRFLTRAFAEAGYLVVALNHRDVTCNGGSARRSWPTGLRS